MKAKRGRKVVLWVLLGIPLLCILFALATYISNLSLPVHSSVLERLSTQDKAQIAGFYRLKAALGNEVWPGFGVQGGPLILYNEDYAFLLGVQDPPDGWVKVPETQVRGGAWEAVPADDLDGRSYYRQRVADPGREIGAFTVRIGEKYAPSLASLEWMRIGLAGEMRKDLPPVVADIFPYRIFPFGTFTAEWHIFDLQHEAFHAFEGTQAPDRLNEAEMAERSFGEAYSSAAGGMTEAWKSELALLQKGVKAASDAEAFEIARQFLAQRAQRREQAGLSADLVQYEREREWLEGLAKYAELAMWQAASRAQGFSPAALPPGVEGVNGYRGFQNNWNEQARLLGQQATIEGDGRFYYSGWAQAVLLDRLSADWKTRPCSRESSWRTCWPKRCIEGDKVFVECLE